MGIMIFQLLMELFLTTQPVIMAIIILQLMMMKIVMAIMKVKTMMIILMVTIKQPEEEIIT